MVLSKRERYIGIATAAAVGLLILNSLVLDPLLAEQQQLDLSITKAQAEEGNDQDVLDQGAKLSKRWRQMYSPADAHSAVLADESKATSQLYNNISAWSREAGLNPPPSLKSDRAADKEKDFQRISIHATATGSMSQIGKFLWKIQTADVPVRVTELQFTSRKDGVDDLKVDMDIATVYFSPPPLPSPNAAPANTSNSDTSVSENWEARR